MTKSAALLLWSSLLCLCFPFMLRVFSGASMTGREVATAAEAAAMAPATASKAVSKKRKLESTADTSSAAAEGPLQEAPKGQLQGHSQCVSGVVWPDQDSIYSGSWDHSVCPLTLHHILRGTLLSSHVAALPFFLLLHFLWLSHVPTSPHCTPSKVLGFPFGASVQDQCIARRILKYASST